VRHGFVFLGGVSSGRWCGCVEGGSDFYGGFLDYAGGVCIRKEYELPISGVLCLFWIWSSSSFAM
jgi:hypothetical protein